MAQVHGVAYTARGTSAKNESMAALAPYGQPRRASWLAGLFAAGLVLSATAQAGAIRREFHFQSIGVEQGLAQNTVSAFLQDSDGFIWVGTDSGLQKFDGYRFADFTAPRGPNQVVPEGPITALAEDASRVLWIGTLGAGLVRHPLDTGRFEGVPLAGATEGVNSILFDPRRGLWVCSSRRLWLLDPADGRILREITPPADSALLLRQLSLGKDGTLWAASSDGLYRLQPAGDGFERVAAGAIVDARSVLHGADGRVHVASSRGLYRLSGDDAVRTWPRDGERVVNALVEDRRGRLWLSVPRGGLVLVDPDDGSAQELPPDAGSGSPPDAIATVLSIDRSGLLWIGTHERGLAKVDPEGTPFLHVAEGDVAQLRTATNYVRSIAEDVDGSLWLGTEAGLKRYDPRQNRFESWSDLLGESAPPAPHVAVHAIVRARDGTLWLGTSKGVARVDARTRRLDVVALDAQVDSPSAGRSEARALELASDGSMWVGTMRDGLIRHDPATGRNERWRRTASEGAHGGLGDNRVLAVHEDRAGRIWAASMTGLNLIDPRSGQVRIFHKDPADPRSLSANLVRTIHETADGELWFGTQSGLNRLDALDAGGARFTRWLPRDGLPGGTVYALASDAAGRIWLSTNRGIASFERKGATFRTFTLADGLQGMEYNGGAVATLADGRIAFGGTNGFNLFAPQAIAGSRYAAPVAITRVQVGPRELPVEHAGGVIEMDAADRLVRFEFAALDYAAPERNRFRYRLEGFDDDWVDAGTRHDATYTNLGAGSYRFQVSAANHDGYWGEAVAQANLRVVPPWWESVPARALWLMLAGVALVLAWNARRRQRRRVLVHHLDLKEREDRLRLALWGSGDDFWDWDMLGQSIVVTGSGDLFGDGSHEENVLGNEWFAERMHPDDMPLVQQRLQKHIDRTSETFESEHRLRNHRGEWVWSLARGKIVERDADGRPLRMCGTARDVTLERAAEHDRRVAHEVIHSMSEAVAVTDTSHRFISVNPAFTRMTGWRREEALGRSASLLDCSQHPPEHYHAIRDELARSGHWRGELWQRRRNGEEFLSKVEVSEIRDGSGVRTHFVSVITDITDRKRAEQELRYLANYDALTGLPNRTLLTERIGHAIIRARRGNRKVAVLFLDLDRFKHVNDSMGHATGDRMLKAAGGRLRHVVREGDSVARLGGDEFTVVLENIGSAAEAERVAEKIIAAFEEPLELDNGQEVVISPSIGIALHPDHGQVPSDLLKFADTAMYQAKDHGRKTWMVYTEAMDAAARLRATTVAALRKALERNELSLVYQPKLSLLDNRITGVEALLRWRSGDLGNVSPGVFIPIAEETGMIVEIGDWVVAQACAQLARWRDAGVHGITMSINVSVAQLLRGDLIQRLCDVLAEHDIAPNLLELELTESMVMANAEQSITTLRRLKAIGVTLAIDDFGTGYSSLSYLKRLPIDTLKIDKEFVGDITTDPDDEAITATVITMAHSLGLNVIAEGVERAEQVDYLREQDCDEVQGHWLSLPLPPDQCLAFLRERLGEAHPVVGERG